MKAQAAAAPSIRTQAETGAVAARTATTSRPIR